MFVVLEGIDGAGTTTQATMLAQWFRAQGRTVHTTAEPSEGPIGKLARAMLAGDLRSFDGEPIDRETFALVFAADRRHHCHNEIEPALADGAVVISDRYVHSSYVYQGDVDGDDHFDIDWVRVINERSTAADITFFVEVPVEVSLSRLGDRAQHDIYETKEKLERLALRYRQVVKTLQSEGHAIQTIDGTLSPDDVHAAIVEKISTI